MLLDFKYHRVAKLPYADGTYSQTPRIKEPLWFTLKNGVPCTLFPLHDANDAPQTLNQVLQDEFNYVVDEGLTYPHHEPMDYDQFIKYWYTHFAAVLIEGHYDSIAQLTDRGSEFWNVVFLGTYYIKPNYIGRCSHVCNAGFVVNHEKRGLGIGKLLGTSYLEWAPQLGYVYLVFNLVFETNTASLRLWDSLGFQRIGYLQDVAVLKGHEQLIGAVMFGKELVKKEEHTEE